MIERPGRVASDNRSRGALGAAPKQARGEARKPCHFQSRAREEHRDRPSSLPVHPLQEPRM